MSYHLDELPDSPARSVMIAARRRAVSQLPGLVGQIDASAVLFGMAAIIADIQEHVKKLEEERKP